jgi:hypothetical protein
MIIPLCVCTQHWPPTLARLSAVKHVENLLTPWSRSRLLPLSETELFKHQQSSGEQRSAICSTHVAKQGPSTAALLDMN